MLISRYCLPYIVAVFHLVLRRSYLVVFLKSILFSASFLSLSLVVIYRRSLPYNVSLPSCRRTLSISVVFCNRKSNSKVNFIIIYEIGFWHR